MELSCASLVRFPWPVQLKYGRHSGWSGAAARGRYARVRCLLRAGEAVLMIPDKPVICCPACGCARKFLHALRPRARPPPGVPSFASLT